MKDLRNTIFVKENTYKKNIGKGTECVEIGE